MKLNSKKNIDDLTIKELKKELVELYMLDYKLIYSDHTSFFGKLRDRIIESDIRWVHGESFAYTCFEDVVALVGFSGLVFLFAPEYFKEFLTFGTIVVATHIALPFVYEKSIDVLDNAIINLRKIVHKKQRENIASEEDRIYKKIKSIELNLKN